MRELTSQAIVKIFGIPIITIDEWVEMETLNSQDMVQEKPKKFSELFPKAVNAKPEA